MKIYIAGPMTGRENFNREAFNKEADRLARHGHTVLNPASLPDGLEQREYMDICFAMLRCADAILMLPGWQTSSGATAEYHYAYKMKLPVYTTLHYPPVAEGKPQQITVTVHRLEKSSTRTISGTTVNFKVIQKGKVLIEDSFSGFTKEPYSRSYEANCSTSPLIVEHDLPGIQITATCATTVA